MSRWVGLQTNSSSCICTFVEERMKEDSPRFPHQRRQGRAGSLFLFSRFRVSIGRQIIVVVRSMPSRCHPTSSHGVMGRFRYDFVIPRLTCGCNFVCSERERKRETKVFSVVVAHRPSAHPFVRRNRPRGQIEMAPTTAIHAAIHP